MLLLFAWRTPGKPDKYKSTEERRWNFLNIIDETAAAEKV
jgi:hypothetical protein